MHFAALLVPTSIEPHHVQREALQSGHRLHPHQQAGAPAQRGRVHPAGREESLRQQAGGHLGEFAAEQNSD